MFGLSGEKVFQESGTLSGGEKTKLALAMLMVGRNNLLLLDEPTNNLDPPSRQAVADALVDWPGAIILVSHDEDFVRELAHQGAADARRRRRLLLRGLARPRQHVLSVPGPLLTRDGRNDVRRRDVSGRGQTPGWLTGGRMLRVQHLAVDLHVEDALLAGDQRHAGTVTPCRVA
jgi:ABC-type cobalamin transport system ATPase subunit